MAPARTDHPQQQQQQSQQPQQPQQHSVFVDAISGQHVGDPQSLLSLRRFTYTPDYGVVFDVWVDDPQKHALLGANSRFSLPAIAQRVQGLAADAAACAGQQLHHAMQTFQRSRQQQQ